MIIDRCVEDLTPAEILRTIAKQANRASIFSPSTPGSCGNTCRWFDPQDGACLPGGALLVRWMLHTTGRIHVRTLRRHGRIMQEYDVTFSLAMGCGPVAGRRLRCRPVRRIGDVGELVQRPGRRVAR